MTDDGRLLRQYVHQGSQAAFSALVARHLHFVYSVCRREVGEDAALAEDVTQVVFLLLARKAPALRPEQSLSGWLFQTARFAARNARRRDARRKAGEARALEQTPSPDENPSALWDQVGPVLNDALGALGARDREAVLLRFADGLSFPELGAALGTSEDAARMRLGRAVDRLRRFFAKEGVMLSAAALTVLLAARVTQAAPAPAVAKIIGGVTAGVGGATTISPTVHLHLQGALKAMTLRIKLAAALGVGVALVASLPFITQAQNGPAAPLARTVVSAAPRPGSLNALVMPGAQLGNGGTVSRMQIQTYTVVRPYDEVCQFYSRAFLDNDFQTLGVTGVRGNNDTHGAYALHQTPGVRTGAFSQSTPKYAVSAFVTWAVAEDKTEVTLVYEPKQP